MPSNLSPEEVKRRKKVIFRANHRGIKEMDVLLGSYAQAKAMSLGENRLCAFELLLEQSDRDLLNWFTGEAELPSDLSKKLVGEILEHTRLNPVV